MTWAERFGDLATNIALVVINLARIFTVLGKAAAVTVDGFITSLAESSEGGIRPTGGGTKAWTGFLAAVGWGIAAITLRLISIGTTFIRQVTTSVDDFFRELAEG
jgi:hypothetical protein